MTSDRIRGVMVPILTPFTPDEKVDFGSLSRLVDYLLDNGVHGIWAAGTTGEFSALEDEQRLAAIEAVVDRVAGRAPIIANVSATSTEAAVKMGLALKGIAVDGIAATPPYYFPCAQDELLAHFRYIKDRVGLPLWIYNIPVTVKTSVDPATTAQLAEEGTVAGIKDSSGTGELHAQLVMLCEQRGIDLYRFLGSTFRVSTASAVGAHGVIPNIANLVPAITSASWEAGEAGDIEKAREFDAKLVVALKVQKLAKGGGPNAAVLSGVKSALVALGVIDHDHVSRPLRPLTDDEKSHIPAILKELGLSASVGVS
ncbi:MAG: dihydrodipicolinate synthase family protein [Chloroflexi bacterium]|nr:dihydrodipicolinate synthase family protein [Chloroflexota bacterium]